MFPILVTGRELIKVYQQLTVLLTNELFTDVAQCSSVVVSEVVWFVIGRRKLSLALPSELMSTGLS